MNNSLYDDEMFDSDLESKFSEENFYANPMSTKIFMSLDGESEEIIGNAVVANIEETNEKIPVYSYNSSTYQKYLQGKRIITGVIALRKVTIASFLSLIKKEVTKTLYTENKNKLESQIKELEKISNEDNLKPIGLINMLKSQLSLLQKQEEKDLKIDEFSINNNTGILEKDNLLYYIENANNDNKIGGNTAKFRLEFKSIFDKGPITKIKDVLFIKKQTEINIDKTDIFDVYSFIGNPEF